MDRLLVISDEPALAQALADELPEYTIIPAKNADQLPELAGNVCLIVAEKNSAEGIASLETSIPHHLITRPVRLRELLYTIRERLQAQTPATGEAISLAGGHSFSLRERVFISADGAQRIALTEKEGELFVALLENGDRIMTKDQLLKKVWGYNEDIDTHTLETHVYRLRGKLRQMDAAYDILSPDEGGYRLKT